MTAPVPGRASAGGKGHQGGALAHEVIADVERDAREHTRQAATQKERLAELVLLARAEHIAFRTDIEGRMKQISDAATAAGKTTQVYRAENPESNSIYTMLSVWKGLSVAVEAGFPPDFTKSWQEIGKAATEWKNATGKADPKLIEKLHTVKEMKLPKKAKEKQVAAVVAEINKTVVAERANPTKRKTADPDTARISKVIKMIEKTENGYTLDNCIKLHKWLGDKIAAMQAIAKQKPATPATPATDADNDAARKSAERVITTPSNRKLAVPAREAEHATANTHKRASKKAVKRSRK